MARYVHARPGGALKQKTTAPFSTLCPSGEGSPVNFSIASRRMNWREVEYEEQSEEQGGPGPVPHAYNRDPH